MDVSHLLSEGNLVLRTRAAAGSGCSRPARTTTTPTYIFRVENRQWDLDRLDEVTVSGLVGDLVNRFARVDHPDRRAFSAG